MTIQTLRQMKEGKELDDLLRLHTRKLQTFVNRRVSNREDAEDIVQDTLLQLLRSLRILENPIGQVTSWLYTVAHNLIVNHDLKKREAELPTRSSDPDDDRFMGDLSEIMASDQDDPETQLLRKMVWQELDKALAELPPEQRQAIELTEVQGLSTAEAAKRMQVPLGTFLSRKRYATLHVRKRLHSLYLELIENT